MKLLSTAVLFLCVTGSVSNISAQAVPVDTLNKYGLYDTDRLPQSFHASRRAHVLDSMIEGSVALFLSAPKRTRANDVEYLYHQDPNFYYLTGHLDPESALILLKSPVAIEGVKTREIFFTQARDIKMETWTGRRLGPDGGKSVLGFKIVYPIDSLQEVLAHYVPKAQALYYTPVYERHTHDPVVDTNYLLHDETFHKLRERYPDITLSNLTSVLAALRMVKLPEEIVLLRKAIDITTEAHNEIMRRAEPGWHEYEIQALGEYVFTKNGSEYTGYPCIVGSGENSVILHYNTNRRKTKDGDVVEMDIGAEYHGYTADVTRSFPINGKFTKEQRLIYDLVLEAQDSGIAVCRIDNDFRAAHRACVSVISRGLVALGIMKNEAEYRKYFMHGTSHYLGLDVHDPGTYGKLVENTVLTVEPGIYIKEGSDCDPKWWNIGLRIEDDILVTKNGPVNLSIASPRTADAVEQLMREDKASTSPSHR